MVLQWCYSGICSLFTTVPTVIAIVSSTTAITINTPQVSKYREANVDVLAGAEQLNRQKLSLEEQMR
jgi:hypothetical protein